MTVTDDRIRELVGARVRQSPTPLTASQISRRAARAAMPAGAAAPPPKTHRRSAPQRLTHRRRVPAGALSLAAVTVIVVAAGLVALARRDGGNAPAASSMPLSGVKVGAYFLPTELPADFRMLAVHEHAGDRGRRDPARAVYESADGGRVELHTGDLAVDEPAWRNSAPVPGGVAHWSDANPSAVGEWVSFEVAFDDGRRVDGTTRAVGDGVMTDVLAAVEPGDDAPPTLGHPDYTLVASAESGSDLVIAEWTGYWGPPGGYLGAGSIEVTVRRFRDPIDIDLRVGVWNDASVTGDRTVYRGILGSNPTWYPAPDVEVSVYGTGTIDDNQAIAKLQSVDDAAFSAAVAEIPEAADLAPVIGEIVGFDSGALVDVIGALGDARGVCLTVDETRRCDLAVMARAGYTESDKLVFFDTDLLVDGRWFTTGARIDRGDASFRPPIPAGAETAQLDDRTYYLIEHPADALVVTDSYDNPTMRPSR